MKKFYILSGALLFAGFTMGQGVFKKATPAPKNKMVTAVANPANPVVQYKSGVAPNAQAVIWSETFANGFPAGWTKNNLGADTTQWQYHTPTTNTVSASSKLNSTTKANGYMVYDSDNAGDNNQAEDNSFKTSPINLSGSTNINLQFQQQFTQFYSTTTVIVSDGATSQTFTINNGSVNPTVAVNASSPNPEIVILNISSIAGGKPAVTVEFRWEGSWDYWWQIDDISIVDASANDIALDEYFFYGYEDSTATRYYSQIPKLQATNDTLTFGSRFRNQGASAQTNVTLNASVTGPSTFSGTSSPIATVASGSEDSANLSTDFIPSGDTGTYTVTFNMTATATDDVPSNNSATSSFRVTDTVYARDDDNASSGSWFGAGSLYTIGNVFEILTPDTATSITMLVGSFSNASYNPVGKTISYHLYDFSVDPPAILASNEFHIIDQAEIGTWLTLPIPETPLAPGWYLAAFETFADTMLFLTGSQTTPPLTVFVDVDKDGTWSYLSSTPSVRLNTKAATIPCAGLNATVSSTNTCSGVSNGTVTVNPTGGSGSYTFAWGGGQSTQTVTGLGAGTYNVTVTDGNSCTTTASGTITAVTVTANATSTNTSCGANNGAAAVTSPTGTAYTYAWPGGQTTPAVTGLAAGTYVVTVTQTASQCTGTASVTIAGSTALVATVTSTDPACGQTNGTATVTAPTGTGYTYSWTGGQTAAQATGLLAGSYTVTVTETASGCTDTATVSLSNAGAPTVSSSATNISCFGDATGAIDLAVSGGTSPYFYMWGNGDTAQDLSGIPAGNYTVTVYGADSCAASVSITITEPTALSVTSTTAPGAVNLTVSGGTAPYGYLWSNGAITEDLSGLASGDYSVTVTDSLGCTGYDTVNVWAVGIFERTAKANFTVFPNPNTGTFNVQLTNGIGQYTFVMRNVLGQVVYNEAVAINGNATRQINLSNLGQGIYFLNVSGTDLNKTLRITVK